MPLPRPAPGTLKWWIVGTVGVAMMLGAVIWYGLATQVGAVTPQVIGYDVRGDADVVVTYHVNRPGGSALRCVITALDARHGRVGAAQDEIPAGDGWVRRTVTVRTTQRAVTGVVDSCARVG